MSTTDTSLTVINSMSESTLEGLKDSNGKIPSLANQLIMTHDSESIFPVGAIYMSVNSTSPASIFGGTWTQIKDTFLLSAGDTYTNGATGGEATHTLTVNEMPSHSHNFLCATDLAGDSNSARMAYNNYQWRGQMTSTGGDQPHNNMPPYLVVYMWKRTA